eukprot:NODE_666_length_683_cov_74.384892_g657_i0.p1 GENE.NODE_666_length_683_cov_74.384892_g657_i0~~NODE_666_length_683_cov_74.384892_g657_i0.p1  ORF type:complete len:180 (-),score=68.70 NODE_666_length_683_cov_74.384892_g657_i0:144-611(-)
MAIPVDDDPFRTTTTSSYNNHVEYGGCNAAPLPPQEPFNTSPPAGKPQPELPPQPSNKPQPELPPPQPFNNSLNNNSVGYQSAAVGAYQPPTTTTTTTTTTSNNVYQPQSIAPPSAYPMQPPPATGLYPQMSDPSAPSAPLAPSSNPQFPTARPA